MIKFAPFAVLATLATVSLVSAVVHANTTIDGVADADRAAATGIAEGDMLYTPSGRRLAPVYRVTADGAVQLFLAGRLLTLPPAILSTVNRKLTTSQTTRELLR